MDRRPHRRARRKGGGMIRPTKAKPHAGRRGASRSANTWASDSGKHLTALRGLYGNSRIPSNWRDRLPDPAGYYARHVAKLSRPNAAGWAQGTCPFHEDRNASLSVQVGDARGVWRCMTGCGGGDLVGFHVRLRGLDFKAAVRELVRGFV